MLQNLMLEQGQQVGIGRLNTRQGRVAGPEQVDRMAWTAAMGSGGGGGQWSDQYGGNLMSGGGGKAPANPTPDSRMNMLGRG